MSHADDMRRCLETLDIEGMRRLWASMAPNAPQPQSDHDTLIAIHHARTRAISISFKNRAYSHRWLLDHGLPSALPDELKPQAERMYPQVIDAVGVAVKASSSILQPVARATQRLMCDAVEECYADGTRDPVVVKAQMMEARERAHRYFRDLFEESRRAKA